MTIRGKKGDLANAKVSGSQIQDEYEELANVGRLKWKEIRQIKDSVLTHKLSEQALVPLRKVFSENLAAIDREELRFVYSHPNYLSCVAKLVYFINFSPQKILKQDVAEFFKSLGYDFKTNEYGNQIKTFISGVALESNKLNIGDKAFKFILPDSSGNAIQLDSLQGKVVLIDFWASGCSPCRLEHKNYLEAYQKYQSKGFEILSVSQDQSKSRWIKAMQADNMIWKSVWDANREVTKMYQVFGIPANYLIDPDGVVIKQDLRGGTLAEVLGKMFKE
jgi:peroxiredoxin